MIFEARRIVDSQVLLDDGNCKALAVNRHAQLFKEDSVWLVGLEEPDAFRKPKRLRDSARRIVVTRDHEYRDASLLQAPHLGNKIEAGVVISPIAVVQVPGKKYERHFLPDCEFHQIFKCPPCCPTPHASLQSRRDWIAGAARYAALAAIGLLSAGLAVKHALVPAAERCPGPIDCRRCAALAACSLPAACLARRTTKG